MWPWTVSAFRSHWPQRSGLLWPGAVPIYPVEKKTWHIPRLLLAFQSLSFGLVWCRIIVSDGISQLNHRISATSPISCRRLWLSGTLWLQLEQHSPGWAWISPLWMALDVLSLTCSCHTFTNPQLHRSSFRLSQLSPTMFPWEAHLTDGSGIHKSPAQGKPVERLCRVTHSPVLPWALLGNILVTSYSCIPFPLHNKPLTGAVSCVHVPPYLTSGPQEIHRICHTASQIFVLWEDAAYMLLPGWQKLKITSPLRGYIGLLQLTGPYENRGKYVFGPKPAEN